MSEANGATPLSCAHCEEEFSPDERAVNEWGVGTQGPVIVHWHAVCRRRQNIGSVGHQLRLCRCFGGTWTRPSWMSVREEAAIAVRLFHALHSIGITQRAAYWAPR